MQRACSGPRGVQRGGRQGGHQEGDAVPPLRRMPRMALGSEDRLWRAPTALFCTLASGVAKRATRAGTAPSFLTRLLPFSCDSRRGTITGVKATMRLPDVLHTGVRGQGMTRPAVWRAHEHQCNVSEEQGVYTREYAG
jgi:hypothetical protein